MSAKSRPMVMDSRKFLSSLNDSVQAKVQFIESKISQMGKQAGRNWKLAALRSANLFIEDVTDGVFYAADYRREKGGKVVIENIKLVQIVESEKSKLFQESCYDLVNAIETNDQKGMAAAFGRMASQRFSSRAIPYSGKVRTRDGVVRSINVQTSQRMDESAKARLISAIVESLKDQVTVKNGLVVEGRFNDGKPFRLPVTKWSKHKSTARHMREAAQNAYWSQGFQGRVYKTAQLLHEDKVEEAVKFVAPFLKEYEEFTLLTRDQVKTLVENALAANGIFNQQLCDNTALLMYRTNLRVNKDTILAEWRGIAKASQHPTLLENVNILGRAKNFEVAADKFLNLVFEAMSNRDVTAEALATTLEVLRDRTPKIKESHDLSSKLDDLINRLKSKEFDDNSLYEAEDFIATVQEELTMGEDLQNFDEVPGGGDLPEEPDADGAELGAELGAEKANQQQQPGVVFNAPLISIGADAAASMGLGGDEEDDEDEGPGPDLSGLEAGANQGMEGEQDDLMGGGAAAAGAGGPPGFGMESRNRKRNPLNEEWDEKKYGKAPWKKGEEGEDAEECSECGNAPCSCDDESDDPYDFKESIQIDHSVGSDYGAPAIADASDVSRVINAMVKLAESHNLTGNKLQESLEDLALAGFEATGMRIPHRKLSNAVEQVVSVFSEMVADAGVVAEPVEDEEDVLGVDDEPVEDQHKWGTRRHVWGRKKAAIGQAEKGKTKSESKITWHVAQEDAVLGEMAGVKFVFDHGGTDANMKPVILSEDGRSEVPVPANLFDSAFAAANMAKGDPAPFIAWLREGLEQLRPESPEEAEGMDAEIGDEPGPADELEGAADDMNAAQDDLGAAGEELEAAGDELGGAPEDDMSPVDDELGGDLAGDLVGDLVGDEEMGGESTVTIKAGPQGVAIDVNSPDVQINQGVGGEPMPGEEPGMDDMGGDEMGGDEMDGEEMDAVPGEEEEMQQVDSVTAPPAAPGGEHGAEGEPEGGDEFPDFGDEEPGLGEDEDVTSPKSTKYTKEVRGDLRDEPEAKLPGKAGNELKGFDKLKTGSKSGSGSAPAKKSD